MTERRYTFISIPGDDERGIETTWYVFDRKTGKSQEAEDMRDARDKARQINRCIEE